MFKIYANGNFVNECLGYANALRLARKCKECFTSSSDIVIIEDIKGRVIDTF
jgi:hypothetical protein